MDGDSGTRRSSRKKTTTTTSWTTHDENEKKKIKRRRQTKKTSTAAAASTPNVMIKQEEEIEDIEDFGKEQSCKIRSSLLEWYHNNQRDLPWRNININTTTCTSTRAYAVWVSEIMLQQTRVDTVIHYFNRWINKWPTLVHLSNASLEVRSFSLPYLSPLIENVINILLLFVSQEVNQMWAGLGYYRRARFLLEGAKFIVQQNGQFPNTLSDLRNIPGIGDYTAGAIASIAFQQVLVTPPYPP